MSILVRGMELDFSDPSNFVAVIGSREATREERVAAFNLGRSLAKAGLTVVSGLARGIDTEAHLGALSAEVHTPKTLAILSTSPKEKIYPPENQWVLDKIKEQGAILYPYPKSAPWTKERFGPKQRRLAERSVMQAVIPSTIYVVSDSDYIVGGTRWALNYGVYLGRNVFRYDSSEKVHPNPEFKVEKRLITWDMELNWQEAYRALVEGDYKHVRS
jgi:hypothetical protein